MSSFNKATVALIMGIIGMLNVFGFNFGLSEMSVAAVVSVITPFLVYMIPNLPKDPV